MMLSAAILGRKKSSSSACFWIEAPLGQGSCGCVCRGGGPGRGHGLLAWKRCAKGMVEGREVAQSLHPLPAVGGEMQPPGQRLQLRSFSRSRSTRMQTAVPRAMEAAEVGLTSLVATSSAWQGKTDPCTRISTTHTTGNSTRTHTHTTCSHTDVSLPSCCRPGTRAQEAETRVNVGVLSERPVPCQAW